MIEDKLTIEPFNNTRMTIDKMTVDRINFDGMTVSEMLIHKMTEENNFGWNACKQNNYKLK
jgi:hypothetical protein